jgi:hypothetical protein
MWYSRLTYWGQDGIDLGTLSTCDPTHFLSCDGAASNDVGQAVQVSDAETECHGSFVAICFAADLGDSHLLRACRTGHNRRGLVYSYVRSQNRRPGYSRGGNTEQQRCIRLNTLGDCLHVNVPVLDHIDRLALPNKKSSKKKNCHLLLEHSDWVAASVR